MSDLSPEVDTFLTLWRHRTAIDDKLQSLADEIRRRARLHDRTKLERSLFAGFVGVNSGVRDDTTESAVRQHITTELHHPDAHLHPHLMTFIDIIEMVCDWYAAAYAYQHNENSYSFMEGVQRELESRDFSKEQKWLIRQVADWINQNE